MPQRFGLDEDLSVMENMRLYAQLRGKDADTNAVLLSEWLYFPRLAPFKGGLPATLSGRIKTSVR